LTALLPEMALFFENGIDLFKPARNSVHYFRYASPSIQGTFKKFVQSHFDRREIVTRIGFHEAIADQGVNFRFT
jgi:hypothetical protein